MATTDYVLNFLEELNEILMHIVGEVEFEKMAPSLAQIKVNAWKKEKETRLENVYSTYNLTPAQQAKIQKHVDITNGYISKLETIIANKAAELNTQNQPE